MDAPDIAFVDSPDGQREFSYYPQNRVIGLPTATDKLQCFYLWVGLSAALRGLVGALSHESIHDLLYLLEGERVTLALDCLYKEGGGNYYDRRGVYLSPKWCRVGAERFFPLILTEFFYTNYWSLRLLLPIPYLLIKRVWHKS